MNVFIIIITTIILGFSDEFPCLIIAVFAAAGPLCQEHNSGQNTD